jgi:hypothetical protein
VRPPDSSTGLANLVSGALVITALMSFLTTLFGPVPDVGDRSWTALFQLNSAMLVVQSLAFAYLARVVILGTGDPARPVAATNLATGSLVLVAIGAVFLAIGPLLIPVTGANTFWVVLGWLAGPVAMTAFVASFGLGLADASGTIEPAVHTEQPVPA